MHLLDVQRATEKDAARVKIILADYAVAIAHPEIDDDEAVARYLRTPCAFWLATAGTEVVGCAGVRPLYSDALELKRVYVRAAYRGVGLADALLAAAEAFARTSGATWLYLSSTSELLAAQRLYHRRGYVPCARYIEDPNATVFMRREL